MINIGSLRERITIQTPTKATSPSGERTLSWTNTATGVPARITGLSSRDLLQAQQANVVATHRIRIRFRDDITPSSRIVWRSRNLEVSGIPTPDEHRTYLDILVKEST